MAQTSTRTAQAKVVSDARRIANQRNALRSTGPKTEEGKQRARLNAVKHGLTGVGIALPTEMAAAVEFRFMAIQEELAPTTVLGAFFAYQAALSTVRCQRAAQHEAAILAQRVRNAPAAHDELRKAQADHLMGWIGVEPIAYQRQLMATPEGCDTLIAGIQTLIDELNKPQISWDYHHNDKLEAYLGRRETDLPRSRGIKLSRAIKGDYSELEPGELDGLETVSEKANYACDRLTEYLEAEIQRLQTHRATLCQSTADLDRAEAAARALFDDSKEATLARKYEATAKRDLYRALEQFYVVEMTEGANSADPPDLTPGAATVAATVEPAPEPEPDPVVGAGDAADPSTVEVAPKAPNPMPAGDLGAAMASFEQRSRPNPKPAEPPTGPTGPVPFLATRPPIPGVSQG